ncbi:hypothetical protein HAX54_010940 [Datura stramonium]|uniref:CCT domain-containing protein n=1 Tax=Datura stramonium TaxID=4076 RepID=A0ABS8RWU0_DATST|nr:hypothetical protein [Datura stramonium]
MVAAVSSENPSQTMSVTADSMVMNSGCNGSIILPFPSGPVHSSISLSLSNVTGESSKATDCQDCGFSPVFLNGESLWDLDLDMETSNQNALQDLLDDYKTHLFGKKIRYASRKARADTRRRVKGRFVKAVESYDYDPLTTRDF